MNVLFRFLTIYYSLVSFIKRKVLIKNIKKDDLVLDVGSGDKPHWRADVIVDKFLDDDRQRATGGILFDKKKLFISADVENFPFKDKAFDYVFCSHLLEHAENPGRAIEEIVRVGKKGYLEVPLAILDFLKPFNSHLWLCDYEKGELIFLRKEEREDFIKRVMFKFGRRLFDTPCFQYLVARNSSFFFISIYWSEKIPYRIEKKTSTPYIYTRNDSLKGKKGPGLSFYNLFYFLMTAIFYRRKKINKKEILNH